VSKVYQQVYKITQQIPTGKVLTYGLISNLLEGRLSAQGVGWALKALATQAQKEPTLKKTPWHRVVNSQGGLSTGKNPNILPGLQKTLLEKEGVKFDHEEKICLDKYLWKKGLAMLS
jgi:methylated-DNA-protein-cysteine methyltransferase-like protein